MQMMDVRDRLKKNIALAMQAMGDSLTSGHAVDFAGYKERVGRLRGLRDGMDIIDQVFNKILDEGEDE